MSLLTIFTRVCMTAASVSEGLAVCATCIAQVSVGNGILEISDLAVRFSFKFVLALTPRSRQSLTYIPKCLLRSSTTARSSGRVHGSRAR